MPPILNAQGVSKRFGAVPLFDQISFVVSDGDRFGLIRFGSRLDVYLPDTIRVMVGIGATAIAGETVLADVKASEAPRSFKAG